jgi:hypothetical protein
MTITEFSDQFDVLFNNITSNQAPGCNEYEKSLFLTKAEKEIVKNYFTANSAGNTIKEGFDDSAKRQADFSTLMKTDVCIKQDNFPGVRVDNRTDVYLLPKDTFIIINESITTDDDKILQVVPIRFDEYTSLMSRPFKRPLRYQAWRLSNTGFTDGRETTRYVEILTNEDDIISTYKVRYIRYPKPIIVGDLQGLTIDGESEVSQLCEVDPILHDEIVQRAVELAKVAWIATSADGYTALVQSGQRGE